MVVAATHVTLHELRAIKLILPKLANRAEICERFLREAQAVARLRSEHIARVHDVGTIDGGVPYMVIEYVEGADLASVLDHRLPALGGRPARNRRAAAANHTIGIVEERPLQHTRRIGRGIKIDA